MERTRSLPNLSQEQTEPTRVLLVDDDTRLLSSLQRALILQGFEVTTADSAGSALPVIDELNPGVVVLDVAMPGMDGLTFCSLLRRQSTVPILMLTARDEVQDRVQGLNAGADDYLLKPFALPELVARINALIRRAARRTAIDVYEYEDLRLDRRTWEARRGGHTVEVTATEFLILERLMSEPQRVFSRDELMRAAWGDDSAVESNVVDVHISNLRRKLQAEGGRPLIRTVRRAGYALKVDEED